MSGDTGTCDAKPGGGPRPGGGRRGEDPSKTLVGPFDDAATWAHPLALVVGGTGDGASTGDDLLVPSDFSSVEDFFVTDRGVRSFFEEPFFPFNPVEDFFGPV